MEVLDESHEEERNGKKEHVTFAIFVQKRTHPQPPPTIVTSDQTNESNQNQMVRTSLLSIEAKIEIVHGAGWRSYMSELRSNDKPRKRPATDVNSKRFGIWGHVMIILQIPMTP